MYVKKTSQSGMTLVEMLLALGIFSFVALAAFSFIFPYFFMTQRLRESMTDVVDNDLAVRMLMREFENSYIMRTDGLTCGEMDALFKTSNAFGSGVPVTLSPGKKVSFAYSVFAGLAARDINSANGMFVTDSVQYPKDALVLAIHPDDSTYYGFFKVTATNPTLSQITLGDASLGSTGTDCTQNGLSKSLNELYSFSGGGSKGLILHRVRIVSYKRGNEEKTSDKVYRSSWPDEGGAASDPKSLFLNGLIDVTFKSGWESYKDASPSNPSDIQRSGKWTAEMAFKVYQRSMVNQQASADHKGERIYDIVSRASYDLSATRRINAAVETSAATVELQFPTCGVMASDSPISVTYKGAYVNDLKNTKAYRISATVSVDVAPTITAQLNLPGPPPPGPAPVASCYLEQELRGHDYEVDAMGPQSMSISVDQTGELSTYICLASGAWNLQAIMYYFDTKLQRTLPVSCSGDVINAPSSYKFSQANQTAKCYRNGVIEFGSKLVDFETGKSPGPALYIDKDKSCEWSDALGVPSDCNPLKHINAELTSVRFLPDGISVTNFPAGDGLNATCK